MASFGDHLRRAREERSLTLQDISASTKISTRSLQALEDEHFDLLPGGIFNKGFVRAYARCVGLDEEKILAEYLAAAKVAAPESEMLTLSSQLPSAREVANEPWPVSAASLVGILAMIVALGLGALWLKEHRKEVREQAAAGQRADSQAPSAAGGDAAKPVASPAPPPAVQSSAEATQPAPVAGTQPATQPAVAPATQPIAPAPPAKQRAPVASGPGTAPVEISISATKRAWISVQSDGKTVETLTLDPENPELRSRSYSAKEKLLLTMGNPAGLTVTYNGKPTGTLGTLGQRATITFTPEGMEKQ